MGDLFDAIETLEQENIAKGEKEGEDVRKNQLYLEAFKFGWQQACHIQIECGKLEGIFGAYLENTPCLLLQDKLAITKFLNTLKDSSKWDPSNTAELENHLRVVHIKAKFLLKKLNIPCNILGREVDDEF